MTPEQFTYWLQGFFELSGTTTLNEEQIVCIKEHIGLTLTKVTTLSPKQENSIPDNRIIINPQSGRRYC
jgi:hypothetical protein